MGVHKRFASLLLAAGLLLYIAVPAQQVVTALTRSTPEAEGVSATDIHRFIDAANKSKNEFHSFVFVRHGNVIAEGWWDPYKSSLKHTLYSTSKSFTSTGIGFAVSEGKIKLTDKVVSFFPGELPDTISPLLAGLTIKNLITMSVGQGPDPTGAIIKDTGWVRHFFTTPIIDTPGTKFLYNSAATYMLSAIIQKVTGQKLLDYLQPRLFEPLGIRGMDWEVSTEDINTGGWGLRLKTEDLAKFGQLYLQKGMWKGKQVLPKEWIDEATTLKIKTAADTAVTQKANSDWAQGYCYQFWRCRNNAFRADGAFGQYIIVMPDKDAVIAITSETSDMQSILNLVWEYLLPSMKEGKLAANDKEDNALIEQLSTLSLPIPAVGRDSVMEAKVTGKAFAMEANEQGIEKISFMFQHNICRLTLQSQGKTYPALFGTGKWTKGITQFPSGPPSLTGKPRAGSQGFAVSKIATAYSWKKDGTLVLTMKYIESPHTQTILCTFNNDAVSVRFDNSIKGMTPGGNDKNPVLNGKLEKQN
ncbi:MAG: serine hydrolase [Agriterribacter sp.]